MLWHHVEGINYAVETSGERYFKFAYAFPFDPFRTILGKALTHYSFIFGMRVSRGCGLRCGTPIFAPIN
jgi:hypothetical protein